MMDKELRELEHILEAERRLYEVHLKSLAEQQQHLIESDLSGLRDSIDQIDRLALEAVSLENCRKILIASITKELKADNMDITLSKLLSRFKGNNFRQIRRLRNIVLNLYEKTAARKENNEVLISQSMNVLGRAAVCFNGGNNPATTDKISSKDSVSVEVIDG